MHLNPPAWQECRLALVTYSRSAAKLPSGQHDHACPRPSTGLRGWSLRIDKQSHSSKGTGVVSKTGKSKTRVRGDDEAVPGVKNVPSLTASLLFWYSLLLLLWFTFIFISAAFEWYTFHSFQSCRSAGCYQWPKVIYGSHVHTVTVHGMFLFINDLHSSILILHNDSVNNHGCIRAHFSAEQKHTIWLRSLLVSADESRLFFNGTLTYHHQYKLSNWKHLT